MLERQSKDILSVITADLNYSQILNLCKTNKEINRKICENDNFWLAKLINKRMINNLY
jgi:hypothetical protein